MEAEFLLSSVTASDGGLYKCCYRSPSGGSEDSEPLQLAVTGESRQAARGGGDSSVLPASPPSRASSGAASPSGGGRAGSDLRGPARGGSLGLGRAAALLVSAPLRAKRRAWHWPGHREGREALRRDPASPSPGRFGRPSLWALPSPEEASGHEVTLQCQSEQRHDRAVLYKDGGPVAFGVARRRETGSQTNFSLPAGSAARGGTYSCYSFHSGSPYEWSAPSEPLALGLMGQPPAREEKGKSSPTWGSVSLPCPAWRGPRAGPSLEPEGMDPGSRRPGGQLRKLRQTVVKEHSGDHAASKCLGLNLNTDLLTADPGIYTESPASSKLGSSSQASISPISNLLPPPPQKKKEKRFIKAFVLIPRRERCSQAKPL
ncbi:leukocyte immunoglobulin-like receptor subfamily B member 5 isoform X5 [Monodelphis domestica]|uniref:leukocyte immunoglobulin-like receptor subfamily B member 5 isoform X5 n=1 Tax=Monodelphis domestica TaxID=13616 RepID=UPI0024E25DEC|nr:leukocyte immunoglobulin-like receptor subfamily B member 5 isoform X5 [Monodelphis domestica]